MINVTMIPQRLEDRVRKTQHHNVLRGFFSQKMVNAKRILLAKRVADNAVEFLRGRQIRAERLFDDNARPSARRGFVEAELFELFEDALELRRRDRQVKKPVALRAA